MNGLFLKDKKKEDKLMAEKYKVVDNGFFVYIEDTTLTEDKHEGAITEIYPLCKELNRLTEENKSLTEENKNLKELIILIANASCADEFDNVKEILRFM
jgi:hypothetical protein